MSKLLEGQDPRRLSTGEFRIRSEGQDPMKIAKFLLKAKASILHSLTICPLPFPHPRVAPHTTPLRNFRPQGAWAGLLPILVLPSDPV